MRVIAARTLRPAVLAAAAVVVGLLTTGCGGEPGSSTGKSGGAVHVRLYGGDWQSLNPAIATGFGSETMVMALYDRLLTYTSQGKFVPYLAKSWKATPTRATFKLRTDATCVDGTPVTASVIKRSLEYLAEAKAAAGNAALVFGSGKPTFSADDATATLTVKLSKPYGDLLLGLSTEFASVICPAGLKSPSTMDSRSQGSGPFVLTKSVRGHSYTLVPRKGYVWGPQGYKSSTFPYKQIVAEVITNETTAANDLVTGGLDIGNVAGPDSRRVAKAKAAFSLKTSIPGSDVLLMNQTPGLPGADLAVRKAVFSLIDPTAMNQAATGGLATLSNTIMSPTTLACYDAENGAGAIKHDVAHAQSVLEAAGWTRRGGHWTKNGKRLSLRVLMTTGYASAPDYLQSTLASFGINTDVKAVEINQYINVLVNTGDWDLTYFPLPGPFPSVQNLAAQLSGVFPPDGANFGHVVNPTFDRYAARARRELAAQACPDWQSAERALLARADVRPIALEDIYWFGNGVRFRIHGGVLLDLTSLRPS